MFRGLGRAHDSEGMVQEELKDHIQNLLAGGREHTGNDIGF